MRQSATYSKEVRERAVRMVREQGALTMVAKCLIMPPNILLSGCRTADSGLREELPGSLA